MPHGNLPEHQEQPNNFGSFGADIENRKPNYSIIVYNFEKRFHMHQAKVLFYWNIDRKPMCHLRFIYEAYIGLMEMIKSL